MTSPIHHPARDHDAPLQNHVESFAVAEKLTERQQRELDYHKEHAQTHASLVDKPFSWDVIEAPSTRWWNAYWRMYAHLLTQQVGNKDVLVVGCGFGDDALRLAKLGARVSAFDLSQDSLQIAEKLATREGLKIDFRQMPAERLDYADSSFDLILLRDILHHVDIPKTMAEITRVARDDAMVIVNEIYSHSITDRVRKSSFVESAVYPAMQRFIYGPGKPYITEDERKLTERDLRTINEHLGDPAFFQHFNFIVTRLLPDRSQLVSQLDQLFLRALKPLGIFLAGRVLFGAPIKKSRVETALR